MTKFNTEVKKGRAGKTPLIILLFVALIILILANLAIDGRNAHSRNEIKEKSAKSDLNIAANQIAKMERQSLINKQDIFKDSNKTVENDDSALDNFQDINKDDYDFQKDYEEYLRIEESKPLPQPAYQNPIPNKIKEKRSSDFEKALSAPTKVDLNFSKNTVQNSSTKNDPYSYLSANQINELKRGKEALEKMSTISQETNGTLNDYAYLQNNDFKLNHNVESITNPFVIKQGSVIPAVLLTGINSDLPGQVSAQVTNDVLDSPFGNSILIPKGSKLIGQYGSGPGFGQTRIMMGFNRLIFPDGKSLNLEAMPGTGSDGYSGFKADVNNHWLKLISYSVFLGGITTAVTLSTDAAYDSEGKITPQAALSQSMGEILGRTMSQVIERNLSLSPTLTVKPGFRFNVAVTKDIEFSGEYTAYDYYN
ncbi:TrbI/VirB10 family protein [uncultured Succinatimonas sp.]|uniref:TrbI/VirB10 family protein n=1 Tax=uncultured Succinatimonas sp. TaxID=1262973 RepID=UPI0025DE1DD2|nr:TrbI/VirB10 family protein [uncultured Succinatimonas sp.]